MANIFSTIRKRKFIAGMAIFIIVLGAYFLLKPKNQAAGATYTYGTVGRGTITQSISATGQVSVTSQVDLKAKASGTVIAVDAVNGQAVKAGTLLAQLDAKDARQTVRDAESSLESARIAMQKLVQPADSLALMQAQNAMLQANESRQTAASDLDESYESGFTVVSSAYLDLADVMTGLQGIVTGSNSYVLQNSANYLEFYYDAISNSESDALKYKSAAGQAYQKARAEYDASFKDYKATSRFSSTSTIESLVDSTYETTKSIAEAVKNTNDFIQLYKDVEARNGTTPQSFADTQLSSLSSYATKVNTRLSSLLAASQSIKNGVKAVATADRAIEEKSESLKEVTSGADPLDVRSQELVVQQKVNALQTAREKLADYSIYAPFDGVIASMDAKVGDTLAANGAVATIISNQMVAQVSLNEVDVARVKLGQKATMMFTAVDGLTLTGKVVQIDTVGTVSQGVVTYGVQIVFDTQDERIKSGMSVDSSIITNVAQNVLLVPSAAVKTSGDSSYVDIPAQPVTVASQTGTSALVKQVAVTVGMSDDTNTEITSGLKEGDTIVAKSASSGAKTTTQTIGGNSILTNFGGARGGASPGR